MKTALRLIFIFVLLAGLFTVQPIQPAYAAGIIVTTNADNSTAGDTFCTLREALDNARLDTDTTSGDCTAGSGTDTITFHSSLSGATINVVSTLVINADLTIDGSALASKITISGDSDNNGTGDVRVFSISPNKTVTLDSLVITKGSFSFGGGIYNSAFGKTLTIMNSTFSNNSATSGHGGAIKTDGHVVVTNSTFSGNSTTGMGGAIYPEGGTVTVSKSTFTNNSAGNNGGALYNNGAALTVTNSTFYANTATNKGGAVYLSGGSSGTIRNSTFSNNSAASASGGGIYYNTSTTLNYANTIIANSTSGGDCAGVGTLGTNTSNLVEDGSCSAGLSSDPSLDSLKDNGGSTETMALLWGSTALHAGDDTTCAASPVNNLDQRGESRPVGAHCDIGAYEGVVDLTAPTVTSFTATSPSNSLNIPITAFAASDNNAVAGYLITTSATQPSNDDPDWAGAVPSTYTVASDGSYTLYPWAQDFSGNVSSVYGSPVSVIVDTAVPTVTSMFRFIPVSSATNASSVDFFVSFSEASLSGLDTSDFTLTTTGTISGASVSSVGYANSSSAIVTVNTGSGDGTIRLDLADDDSITDSAGNKLGGTGTGNGNFTSGQSYTLDKTAPTIDSFSATSPSISFNIPITAFTASDNVAVTDYLITETSSTPSVNDSGWMTSVPSSYTVGSYGAYTLYPWAKDASGNISALYGSPVNVTVVMATSTPTPTETATATESPTVTMTATSTETATPTQTPTFTATPTSTATPTVTLTSKPTSTATPTITRTPTSSAVTITLTSVAAQDGWILESFETSNVGGTLNSTSSVVSLGDDASKKQYRGILSFKTSSIPDTATITGVTLKLKKQNVTGGGNPLSIFQGFMVDLKKGFFGTAATLQTSDFQATASKTVGPFSPTLSSNTYTISLTSAKAYINKLTTSSGLTQIRLRFKLDDNGNTIANYLSLFSSNTTTAANRPQLVITYTIP